MNLSIRHLRLVRAVVDTGTLTAAARRLYVTQSALSHQLADLERRAGAPVFTRVGKRMVLTDAGRRILEVADTTLTRLDELADELRGIAAGRAGTLRLTTRCYTAYHWLPSVLPKFRRAHPGIDFRIVPECSADPLGALLAGELDIALTYEVTESDLFESHALFEDEQVLIVAPDHPLAGRSFVTAEDFAELDLLVYNNEPERTLIFQRLLTPQGIVPRSVNAVRITEAIVALVAGGVGAAAVTRWSVAPEIGAGRVVAVRITERGLWRAWGAVLLRRPEQPRYLLDFIELVAHGPKWIFGGRAQQEVLAHAGVKAPA